MRTKREIGSTQNSLSTLTISLIYLSVLFFFLFLECGSYSDKDGLWITANGGELGRSNFCPFSYTGFRTQSCGLTGAWNGDVDMANCKLVCSRINELDVDWDVGQIGETRRVSCPHSSIGYLSRKCTENGRWGKIESKCGKALETRCASREIH